MPVGKAIAQAGHAFVNTALQLTPEQLHQYQPDGLGTKITLSGSLFDLHVVESLCRTNNIPHYVVVDSGHVCPPDFDGSPIITAIGFGPIAKGDLPFIDKLKLYKGN